MLQPKKPLDLSGANEILKSERPPLDLSGAESVLKKKDATVVNPKSASVTPSGSSVGKNSSGFPEIDMNSVAPGMGVQPKDELKTKNKRIKALETSFYEATKHNDDDEVAEKRTQEAINKEGIWNTIKDVSKKAYNSVLSGASYLAQDDFYAKELSVSEDPLADEKKQVKTEALKNKEKLTEADINTKAAEIYKQKEKDNLFVDRANSFLDNLDPKDKELLRQDRATKATHLQESNTKKLKVVAAMQTVGNEKIKEYKELESQLATLKKNNQELPEDLYKKYTSLGTEIKTIGGNIDKYQNEILKNKSDLGTAQEELDLFQREYGDIKNFIGNIAASSKELGNNLLGGYLWFGDTMAGLVGKHKDKDYNEAMNIASKNIAKNNESIQKDRELLRKPVEVIESVEGFVNYASDLMANQLPNLAATASGARGLALIGTASAGQKFSEMKEEIRQGKVEYSPSQMAFAPLLYGSAEVISEIPTLSILKKGGRVFESIAKNEAELITKTAKQKAVEWAKDYGVDMSKEMSGEQFTNFAQNFNDKYVLGKKNVGLLDNTGQVFKDTFTLTSMLKTVPHVFGAVVKPFQSNNDLDTLDENSRKIIEFSRQLNTEGLTDTEKAVIQKQIDKATAESATIMKNTIGKITDMPSRLYDEVVKLNKEAGELKIQAKEIKEGNLSNKEALLNGLKEDYKNNLQKRNSIIDGTTTPVDVLPLKEQDKIKKQALESLVTELNPDGTKNIKITNEQVVERANEILKESDKNESQQETPVTETQQEAQPQAEEQKTEQEVLANNEELRDSTEISQNEEVSPVEDVVTPSVSEIDKLELDYNSKNVEELVKLKKELYPNPDIESPMSAEEKLLNKVIAKKFSDKNAEIRAKHKEADARKAKGNTPSEQKNNIPQNISESKYVFTDTPSLKNAQAVDINDAGISSQTNIIENIIKNEGHWNKMLLNGVTNEGNGWFEVGKSVQGESVLHAPLTNETVVIRDSENKGGRNGVYKNNFIENNPRNETVPSIDTPVDGTATTGVEPNGTQGENNSVPEAVDTGRGESKVEISDLDHAKSEIEKGVLLWNGDMGAERINLGIPWADIRKGQKDILAGKENTAPAKKLIEALRVAREKGGYEYVQGSGGQMQKQFVSLEDIQRTSNPESLTDAELDLINKNQEALAKEHEDYFNSLDEASQLDILENYENRENNTGEIQRNSEGRTSQNDVPNQEKTGRGTKPSTQEKIAIAEAKIDDIANWLKDVLPSAAINPDDYKSQGLGQDQLIDIIAKAAKNLVSTGIEINDAITQVIDALKQKFDFEVDTNAVKERINPKKEKDGFERKSGKKSLLGRLIEGGNSDAITEALQELSPNYDVRNQEKVDAEAKAFIDKVGIAEALHAAKNYLIPNMDVRMLVYDEALTRLKDEIDSEVQKNPEDRDALIKQFQELSDAFDYELRNMAQGLAIQNYIYNKNQSLKYNLKKLIADYKNNDPNGEIPAEVKAKYEELTQKLKDLEEKTKAAEERAKKAEEELAIKNIQEDIERKKQLANKNKSGLTPKEVARKKELKNKFFGRLNDATGLVAMLADPEFREYLGLTFKQAKGDFKNFSNKIINELGKGAKEHLQKLFDEGQNTITKTEQKVSIGKDGKIKIPAQLFRDLVEQGYNDIDDIAQTIKDNIIEEYPDVELRDIRDALTGYGKQINPNQDEITAQISKLKEYGRLLSAYEDVTNGEMPKKSGLKRLKPEQKARELRREINRLAKELNVEPIDLEKQWASALDKIKSNLKNQIEDLDKQIANGEKRKVERTTTPLDEEATALKELRDAKKQVLDDLVGKPELTEEQKIARAEAALEKSISALQEDIDSNNIAYKEKPTPATSTKLEELRAKKKALLETKKQLREEAGLVEEQRLKSAKNRIKNQIEDLKTRIANKDFAKKEVKPLTADDELNSLRAEKEMIYEEFEKQKYLQELQNRSFGKKFADEALESLGLLRAVKASLDLGLIGIQLRGFTYGELLRNPVELGRKLVRMFGAIGSQTKTNKAMANIIGHPLYHLAKKLDIGITHPDLRNEVREELASGNLLHFIWSLPVTAAERLGAEKFTQKKRKSLGDTFIDAAKKQYNQLAKNNQAATTEKDKFSIAEQWRNVNVFEAVERGLSTYGNQLRFEEFLRGVERLKAEGKDEINHPEDYKALASYIRTFSGRAKPAGFEMNQKALNVFFFSFKNAASVFQQLNPIYYINQHVTSSDFKNGNYTKMSVANKMAMATMFKSVASTSATLLFLMAAYNAMKDDDDEEATIETDPRSSDFGKFKIGNFRYDPWGGYVPLITLYARLLTEESKKSDGTVYKFGEERFGVQSRGDAMAKFLFNKESPGAQAVHHYLVSTEKTDATTGETNRVNAFGQKLSEDEAYSLAPIFMGSAREAIKNDYEGVQLFLTAYSILGLGNTQYYESKEGATPEEKFIDVMEKRRLKGELPKEEKIKEKVETKLEYAERKIQELEYMKMAQKQNKPYYSPSGIKVDVSQKDFSKSEASIAKAKKIIEATRKKHGIKDK